MGQISLKSEQTVQTLKDQSDQGLHCLPFNLHHKINQLHFRALMVIVLGVKIFLELYGMAISGPKYKLRRLYVSGNKSYYASELL